MTHSCLPWGDISPSVLLLYLMLSPDHTPFCSTSAPNFILSLLQCHSIVARHSRPYRIISSISFLQLQLHHVPPTPPGPFSLPFRPSSLLFLGAIVLNRDLPSSFPPSLPPSLLDLVPVR